MTKKGMAMKFEWNLPVDWCHAGAPQGNGLFGGLVWGDSDKLKITVNRADYWFHFGGLEPKDDQTYDNFKKYLFENDEQKLKMVFGGFSADGKRPAAPTRLPMGRLDICLPKGLQAGEMFLNISDSTVMVELDGLAIKSIVPRSLPVMCFSLSGKNADKCKFCSVPADAEPVKQFYRENNFPRFEIFDTQDGSAGGWVQQVPGDRALCVYWRREGDDVFMASALECDVDEARKAAENMVLAAVEKGWDNIVAETSAWWGKYWAETPVIDIPDKEISELYYLGMFRMAGMCSPDAPAATLQGTWVEDHLMAPWSCDYHFNINVQECYWPVFAGNHPEFILPLFDMVKSWEPKLRQYAKNWTGIDDGLMLPHAVDDRGTAMGGFWPGHVDHSCTAWVAQLMWSYWKYTADKEFLAATLYPFMMAVMKVYDGMLETDENGKLFLAAETSPEYHENQFNAWGRNSSIHLASIHFLAGSLLEASEILNLNEPMNERWREICEKLPIASISEQGEICIWDDQPLAEGHRHLSHLAALHPYDLLDWRTDEKTSKILSKTLEKWFSQGMGRWSGWSFPWASIIYSRLGNPETAHSVLSIFRRSFMRDDYALRYLPDTMSFTSFYSGKNKIMQVEAGMASAAAVMEMMVHTSRGVIYSLNGAPCYWKNISFSGILTEGGFLVSGERKCGRLEQLTVKSTKGGFLRIALPEGKFGVEQNGRVRSFCGKAVFETETIADEIIIITAQ
jgi:hypothetical protein